MATQEPRERADAQERGYHPAVAHLLKFFAYEHLPSNLQEVSMPFSTLAHIVANELPDNAEKTVALRKLLESKDCAVRAAL